jgi:hypothetical protein
MGIETIPDRASGQTPQQSWINNFRDVLSGNFIARYLTGAVRANYGRLGTQTYRWKRHHVFTGDMGVGDIMPWYDYNGGYDLPQGWMLCNGVIINEANYDAQHTTGDWDNYVVSTVLNGIYLPSMGSNFPRGTTAAMQSGTSPITNGGISTLNLSHTHGSPRTTSGPSPTFINRTSAVDRLAYNATHTHTVTIPSDLSSVQNIEPEHLLIKFIMRVV